VCVEEVEAHLVASADPLRAGLGGGVCVLDGVGAQGGELDGLEVAPHQLDGGEVVGVAGDRSTTSPEAGTQLPSTVDITQGEVWGHRHRAQLGGCLRAGVPLQRPFRSPSALLKPAW